MESSEDEWEDVLELELEDDELIEDQDELKGQRGSKIRQKHRVESLVELCLIAYFKKFSVAHLERSLIKVNRERRASLCTRLLAASLLARRARPLLLRSLIKLWPNHELSLTDLAALSPRWKSLLANLVLHERPVVRGLLLRLLQTLLDSQGCPIRLTTLDLGCAVALESARSYASTLTQVLLSNRVLLRMLNDNGNNRPLLVTPVKIRSDRETRFWLKFLKFCPKVIRIVRLELISPLKSGFDHANLILKQVQHETMTKLRVEEERLHNIGGHYERDVDHLVDVNQGLYGQEWPQWQRRLMKFSNITCLALVYSVKPEEQRRPSPGCIRNWARVLAKLGHLNSLNLHGNFVGDQLQILMKDMTTNELRCLDLEHCGLTDRDMDFLADSRLINGLKDLNIGDTQLGRHEKALIKLLNKLNNMETLSLCMEQYYLFADRTGLSEPSAMPLLSLLVSRSGHSLRFLNLAGHSWRPETLLNVVKAASRMSKLYNLILPVDGLSDLARQRYEERARRANVALDVDVYGPELALIKEAVATLVANNDNSKESKGGKAKTRSGASKRLRSRALKHGVQFLLM